MIKTETSSQDTTTHKTATYDGNVVLITGGRNALHSAEIFFPNSPSKPCILPELPAPYWRHTQDGGMICGGDNTNIYTCHQWNSEEGKFPERPVHEFKPSRYEHVSWTPASTSETFLIGGGSKSLRSTSTIVKQGLFSGFGGFALKHPLFGACSIPDPETDTVIITGGNLNDPNFKITSLYNENGFVEDFGMLKFKRYRHGCTSYVADQKRVNKFILLTNLCLDYFTDISGNRWILFRDHRDP